MDEPGQGGANHHYDIESDGSLTVLAAIRFQNGPIKEFGINGITQEALLAIVIDRLRSFQAGPYACEDNQRALEHAHQALKFLQKRTLARIARGVEGTNQQ